MNDKTQLAVWCIEKNKEVFINDIEIEYSKYLKDIDYTVPSSVILEDGSIPLSPYSLIYLPLQVKDKIVGLISVQSYKKNAYTIHHLDILKTLASYTSAALYNATSFESLQNTLNELKLTQEQLVQSEKMASLGELTAGIAHEIQNPLNFVNNFSEVNTELVDEMKQEIDKGNTDEVKSIAKNIQENQVKITHHGKRADAIVKSMLQHSRSSTSVKEPTDINALADEYLRLAYHGLRAKDKSFNATMKTDFDESIGKINVLTQDIGRVVLNLITNAFYAVSEKKTQNLKDYNPTVFVSTKKQDGKIQIIVRDNGDGIPQKVVDKIFQPFFTTKPTGKGTGLGLSLAYDIVTKGHGGELKVETKEGEGAEFLIILNA
jgi:signal transduction histidine kinase